MERPSKKLDFLIKHWAAIPRRFPAPFPLVSADLVIGKKAWIDAVFETCNFSLILRGRGLFLRGGREMCVEAPCVITQWPGERVKYGPTPPGGTWDEMYFVYHRRSFTFFQSAGLLDPERPTWPIANPGAVGILLAEFSTFARSQDGGSAADRVDRLAERILLETWVPPAGQRGGQREVDRAAEAMRSNLISPPHPEELARRQGLSPSTFRRQWIEKFAIPPARWLQQLRISEARRLVVETELPISEVASQCGFEDAFYFSRCFRRATGVSPREYRKTFRLERRL